MNGRLQNAPDSRRSSLHQYVASVLAPVADIEVLTTKQLCGTRQSMIPDRVTTNGCWVSSKTITYSDSFKVMASFRLLHFSATVKELCRNQWHFHDIWSSSMDYEYAGVSADCHTSLSTRRRSHWSAWNRVTSHFEISRKSAQAGIRLMKSGD
jgi:hypothetical protein